MLFTSYSFIVFISLLFIIYYLIPKKYQWMLLLGASYIFYSFVGVKFLTYIIFTTLSTYFVAKKIGNLYREQSSYLKENKSELSRDEVKEYKSKNKAARWKWLLSCLLLNFGILAVIKYTNFTINNINYLMGAVGSQRQFGFWDIALPMGISFYTFQTMGYIIDIYRGKYAPERNFFKLALFVSFFPQLIQGPISRFDDLSQTLFEEHSFDSKNLSYGITRILWGFFKKLVIADRMLVGVNTIIQNPDTYQGGFVFVGMLFYAYQLYADFTGGIDITIGIAQVLGIKVKENFQRPYFSKNITEFWRRWHITMGTWFKDYLFYPISVYKPMLNFSKWSRKTLGNSIGKRLPVYISTTVVWFTTGLWHGASWNFIVWGLMNCLVILISQELTPFYNWFHSKFDVKDRFLFRSFQVIRTILLMSSIRLFDLYRDVPMTFRMFGTMFTNFSLAELLNGSLLNIGLSMADYIVLFFGLVILTSVSLLQRQGSVRDRIFMKPAIVRYSVCYALVILVIIFGAYGVGYDASQFIYNQF